MSFLKQSLAAWQTDSFQQVLKEELESLDASVLPLQQAVSQGGFADGENLKVSIYGISDNIDTINVKIGLFFTEIVINCGCGDDPMPINAYGEMLVAINKSSAKAGFELISE